MINFKGRKQYKSYSIVRIALNFGDGAETATAYFTPGIDHIKEITWLAINSKTM